MEIGTYHQQGMGKSIPPLTKFVPPVCINRAKPRVVPSYAKHKSFTASTGGALPKPSLALFLMHSMGIIPTCDREGNNLR